MELQTVTKEEFVGLKKEVDVIEEILEILVDKELMESIKRGRKDMQEGEVYSSAEVEKEIFGENERL